MKPQEDVSAPPQMTIPSKKQQLDINKPLLDDENTMQDQLKDPFEFILPELDKSSQDDLEVSLLTSRLNKKTQILEPNNNQQDSQEFLSETVPLNEEIKFQDALQEESIERISSNEIQELLELEDQQIIANDKIELLIYQDQDQEQENKHEMNIDLLFGMNEQVLEPHQQKRRKQKKSQSQKTDEEQEYEIPLEQSQNDHQNFEAELNKSEQENILEKEETSKNEINMNNLEDKTIFEQLEFDEKEKNIELVEDQVQFIEQNQILSQQDLLTNKDQIHPSSIQMTQESLLKQEEKNQSSGRDKTNQNPSDLSLEDSTILDVQEVFELNNFERESIEEGMKEKIILEKKTNVIEKESNMQIAQNERQSFLDKSFEGVKQTETQTSIADKLENQGTTINLEKSEIDQKGNKEEYFIQHKNEELYIKNNTQENSISIHSRPNSNSPQQTDQSLLDSLFNQNELDDDINDDILTKRSKNLDKILNQKKKKEQIIEQNIQIQNIIDPQQDLLQQFNVKQEQSQPPAEQVEQVINKEIINKEEIKVISENSNEGQPQSPTQDDDLFSIVNSQKSNKKTNQQNESKIKENNPKKKSESLDTLFDIQEQLKQKETSQHDDENQNTEFKEIENDVQSIQQNIKLNIQNKEKPLKERSERQKNPNFSIENNEETEKNSPKKVFSKKNTLDSAQISKEVVLEKKQVQESLEKLKISDSNQLVQENNNESSEKNISKTPTNLLKEEIEDDLFSLRIKQSKQIEAIKQQLGQKQQLVVQDPPKQEEKIRFSPKITFQQLLEYQKEKQNHNEQPQEEVQIDENPFKKNVDGLKDKNLNQDIFLMSQTLGIKNKQKLTPNNDNQGQKQQETYPQIQQDEKKINLKRNSEKDTIKPQPQQNKKQDNELAITAALPPITKTSVIYEGLLNLTYPCDLNQFTDVVCKSCQADKSYLLKSDNWQLFAVTFGLKKSFRGFMEQVKELFFTHDQDANHALNMFVSVSKEMKLCFTLTEQVRKQQNLKTLLYGLSILQNKYLNNHPTIKFPNSAQIKQFNGVFEEEGTKYILKDFQLELDDPMKIQNGLQYTQTFEFKKNFLSCNQNGQINFLNLHVPYQLQLRRWKEDNFHENITIQFDHETPLQKNIVSNYLANEWMNQLYFQTEMTLNLSVEDIEDEFNIVFSVVYK